MDNIKPVHCGCGGEARVIMIMPEVYAVECSKCWIRTGSHARTEAEAVKAWNRAMGADTKEKNMVFLMLMGQAMNNGMLTISSKETIRKDCLYYLEVQDMGAHVPSCTLYEGICNCRCENCIRYASKTEKI